MFCRVHLATFSNVCALALYVLDGVAPAVRSSLDWWVNDAGGAPKLVLSRPNHPSPPPSSLPSDGYSHFLSVTARFISWHSNPLFPQPISSCCTPPSIPFTALFWKELYFERQKRTSGILLVLARARAHTENRGEPLSWDPPKFLVFTSCYFQMCKILIWRDSAVDLRGVNTEPCGIPAQLFVNRMCDG